MTDALQFWFAMDHDEVVTALGYEELVSVVAEHDAVTLERADGMRIRIRVSEAGAPGLVYEWAPPVVSTGAQR